MAETQYHLKSGKACVDPAKCKRSDHTTKTVVDAKQAEVGAIPSSTPLRPTSSSTEVSSLGLVSTSPYVTRRDVYPNVQVNSESRSSYEIKQGSKGETLVTVKVYDDDASRGARAALTIFQYMRKSLDSGSVEPISDEILQRLKSNG